MALDTGLPRDCLREALSPLQQNRRQCIHAAAVDHHDTLFELRQSLFANTPYAVEAAATGEQQSFAGMHTSGSIAIRLGVVVCCRVTRAAGVDGAAREMRA